jgi:zinc protease
VTRVTLDNGIRVLLEPDDGEILALRATAPGGLLGERATHSGRAAAWARVVARATETRGIGQVAPAMEALGGHLGAMAGRNTQALRADLPADRGLEGLELFLDALAAPTFPPEEVTRARQELLEAIDQLDDDPGRRLAEATWAAACPGHPWSLPIGGSRGAIARLRSPALRDLHDRWRGGGGLVLSLAGALDADRALARIRERLGQLPRRAWVPARAAPRFPRATRRLVVESGREQGIVSVAYAGGGVHAPSAPALEVLGAVLNGQAGRLFMELREAHGLAYAVGAQVEDGVFPGLVVVSLATDPGRVAEAERRVLAALATVGAGMIGATEVDRAKATLAGAVAAELQSCAARAAEAASHEVLGLDGTAYRAALHRFERVTTEQVRGVAAALFARPAVIACLVPGRARRRSSG